MTRRAITYWIVGNIAALFGLPWLFGRYLTAEVAWEYENGYRITTDGDSVGLPVVMLFLFLAMLIVVVNSVMYLVWREKKWRQAGRKPESGLFDRRER